MTRVIALLIAATAGAAIAQTQQPRFRTEANFVRVDVYVTQNGQIVSDLRLEDFELFEDGAPQTVSTFEQVNVRAPGGQASRAEPTSQREMVQLAARSERVTLNAFEDLVKYLGGLREERKAIVVVSHGWRLYRRDDSLTKLAKDEAPPGVEQFHVGPGGKITRNDPSDITIGMKPCTT